MIIKIAIVDDHQLFRQGVASMLLSNPEVELVGDYNSGLAFLKAIEEGLKPDIVLLDITMPDMNGLQVLESIKKSSSQVKPIILSMHSDGNYVVQSVRMGAKAYLLKNTDAEELFHALKEVFFGRKYFNKDITELLLNNMYLQADVMKPLTERETEVLKHISKGLTTKEVADLLVLSNRTIETHRVNMMKKLNVKNSAELIKKATQLNLI